MGPRLISRGNADLQSTGEFINSFNGAATDRVAEMRSCRPTSRHGHSSASMGPRLISRGNSRSMARPHRRYRLQWGRD